jgi:uncharacterized protein (DUF2237 family)
MTTLLDYHGPRLYHIAPRYDVSGSGDLWYVCDRWSATHEAVTAPKRTREHAERIAAQMSRDWIAHARKGA